MLSRGLVARHSHEILQPIGDTVQWAQIGALSQQGVCLLSLLHGQLVGESDGALQVGIVPACAAGTVGALRVPCCVSDQDSWSQPLTTVRAIAGCEARANPTACLIT